MDVRRINVMKKSEMRLTGCSGSRGLLREVSKAEGSLLEVIEDVVSLLVVFLLVASLAKLRASLEVLKMKMLVRI
jgi:hypothetical protein